MVAFITGAGLKTMEAVTETESLAPPLRVEPSIASFERAFGERHGGAGVTVDAAR